MLVEHLRERNADLDDRYHIHKIISLHAHRDLIAANKGIRRLVDKLKKRGSA